MTGYFDSVSNALENAKMTTKRGVDYWMARDIQEILGYASWENFQKVIAKARMSSESAGIDPADQFHDTMKMVEVGSGAMVQKGDCFLTRYACYLVAMNGDTNKPEIGMAQTYFVTQTRLQEVQDRLTEEERRIMLRDRVINANKKLGDAAKEAGVEHFGIFHDAGYKGLYGNLGVSAIKYKKGIPIKEDLLEPLAKVLPSCDSAVPGRYFR